MLTARLVICFLAFIGSVERANGKTLKASIPAHSVSHLAFYTAKENGYYREEGLDVELILMPAPVAVRALIGGDVEISTVGGSAIPPIIRGAPLRFLFTTFARPIHWLYSKKTIAAVTELKGRRLAIDGLGGVLESLLREVLTKYGMEAGRDVAVIAMGVPSTRYAALVGGGVDATVLTFPWNFMAAEAGFRELVNFTRQDIVQFTGSIVVREGSDPALVEKFTRATLKGLLHARDHRSAAIAVLARSLKIKEETAGKIYDSSWPAMTLDGTVGEDSQKRAVQGVLKLFGQKESPPLDRVFDFSLARRIRAELLARGWRP
jgi:NitT/TauT family transport system substrate-binding protein